MTISPKYKPRLVIMVKEPRPGRVKTRLGRSIGMTSASWWFRHQSQSLIRRLTDPRWDLILAVSPDIEGMQSRIWPQNIARMPQGPGDLGDRMKRVFQSLPSGPVCIIGADIPAIQKTDIQDAFTSLGRKEAVFGPAPDGGYWLIGLKNVRPVPSTLFQNVRWSTDTALSDTVATIPDFQVGYISTLNDVDTAADL